MDATNWLTSLPENPGPARDNAILDAVSNGIAYCYWVPITSEIPGHRATFQVSDDAVHVDLENGERFRVPVSALLAQKCADVIGGSLPTAKVCDLAYKQADVVLPCVNLPADANMSTTSRSKKYNTLLETKRAGRTGLVRDCGKAWVLSNWLGRAKTQAINYGFYDPAAIYKNPIGIKMWQTLGSRHNYLHTDYSQTLILMEAVCEVDGEQMNVADVMRSPTLWRLISDEGIIPYTRQPGI